MMRGRGWPARLSFLLAVAVATSLASLLGCACAGAATPPSIEAESVSNVSSTDATLEAQVNPGGAPNGIYYQFQIATDLGEYVSELVCPPEPSSGPAHPCLGAHSSDALPIGFAAAGSGPNSVSLDLASVGVTLQPGTSYQYRVLVARAVQSEDTTEWEAPSMLGATHSFTTPSATPPSIEAESVSNVSSTDATLEAQVNPGGAPNGIYYQFQIATDLGEYVSELVCPPEPSSGPAHPCLGAHSSDALPIGFAAAGSGPNSVSLDLASVGVTLQPGTSYQYRVLVARAVQSEDTTEWEAPSMLGATHSFTTPVQVSPPADLAPSVGSVIQPAIHPHPISRSHRRRHRLRRKHDRRVSGRPRVDQASLAG